MKAVQRVREIKLVRDADGAQCRECEMRFDFFTNQAVPWGWREEPSHAREGNRTPNAPLSIRGDSRQMALVCEQEVET